MMTCFSKRSAAVVMFGGMGLVATAANAHTYDFTLEHLGGSISDCHEQALDLGARFTSVTDFPASGSCDAVTSDGNAIVITYESDVPVNVVSTASSNSHVVTYGRYISQAECQNGLAHDQALFANRTGLNPFISYCYRDRNDDQYPWVNATLAFGAAASQPRFSGNYLFGRPLDLTRESLTQQLETGLRQVGVDVSFVRLRPQLAMTDLTVFYYGTDQVDVGVVTGTNVATAAACNAELAIARTFLPDATTALSYCEAAAVGRGAEVTIITIDEEALSIRPSVESFVSYEACVSSRSDLVRYYQETLHRPVLGGLCGRDHDHNRLWRINMIGLNQ